MFPQSVSLSLCLLLSSLFMFGCQSPLTVKQMQAKNPLAKNAAKTPVEIVDAWNSYAQTTPEGTIIRGMAGRVHFYDQQKKGQAVKVDGDLTVFVFDGSETGPLHAKPIKVFQFKADTLEQHYSHQKPLGHGYNFFLPMDEIGGDEQSLCIITRFDNNLDDMLLLAQPVNAILPGRKPQLPTEPTILEFLDSRPLLADVTHSTAAQHDSTIQQAGYVTETAGSQPEQSRVISIPVNNDMSRRLTETREAIQNVDHL